MQIKFNIEKVNGSYFIMRTDCELQTQLGSLERCRTLINYINNNMLPADKILSNCCRELLTYGEYNKLKRKKQRYYNVNKGKN